MQDSDSEPSTGCQSCNEGFHLAPSDPDLVYHGEESEGQMACRTNVCQCSNGIASLTCEQHQSTNCYSCEQGYHLVENLYDVTNHCSLNTCSCGYGKESVGKNCPVHGETGCEDTDASIAIFDSIFDDEKKRNLTNREVMTRFQILCQLSEDCSLLPTQEDTSCQGLNMIDGVYSIGVGFDGTKEYNLNSRRQSLMKHDCSQTNEFEMGGVVFDMPWNIVPEANYKSGGSFQTYDSVENYKSTKAVSAGIEVGNRTFSGSNELAKTALTEAEQNSASNKQSTTSSDSSKSTFSSHSSDSKSVEVEARQGMMSGGANYKDSETTSKQGAKAESKSKSYENENYSHSASKDSRENEAKKSVEAGQSNSNQQNVEQNSLNDQKVNVFIAEKKFSVSLYNLFADISSHRELNPHFLRDFITLPDEIFSIDGAKSFQSFIEKYGTHVITASEFGGQFEIQITSKSSVFDTFDEFDKSSRTEAESMEGNSDDKKVQLESSVDVATGSSTSTGETSASSEEEHNSESSSMAQYEKIIEK